MSADSLQERILFYQNVAEAKDRLMKSESERLHLEKEFHKNINSDKKYLKEKALKLQAYYKKLCDDEQKSNLRNQQLLAELARVDQHFQHMENKLERLATLKKECEKHIHNNYPQWNEISRNILNKINNSDNEPNSSNKNNERPSQQSVINAIVKPGSILLNNSNNNRQNVDQNSIQNGLQNFGEFHNRLGTYMSNTNSNENINRLNNNQNNNSSNNNSFNLQEQLKQNFVYKPDLGYFNTNRTGTGVNETTNNNQQALTGSGTGSSLSKLENQQQNNNQYGIHNLLIKPQTANYSNINNSKQQQQQQQQQAQNEAAANSRNSVLNNLLIKPTINNDSMNNNEYRNHEQQQQNLNNFIADALIKSNPLLTSTGTMSGQMKPPQNPALNDNIIKEYEREIAIQDGSYMMSPNHNMNASMNATHQVLDDLYMGNPLLQHHQQQQQQQSKNQTSWSKTAVVRNFEEKVGVNNRADDNDTEDFSRRRNSSLRQELNVAALYILLDYIESDMSNTIHPQKYYRQSEPAPYKSKLDIIKCARENRSLKDMDAGNVSMVVLDQLPNIVRKHTKNACLFTRDLLGFSVTDINEDVVTQHLTQKKDQELWKRLLQHLCLLKRICSVDAPTLSRLFAPALIAQDGYGEQKAIQFLEKIINLATYNFDLTDKTEDKTESSFYDELLVNSQSKLKDTKTYQNFINSSKQVKRQQQQRSNSDDEDDIERIVAPKSLNVTGGSGGAPATGGGVQFQQQQSQPHYQVHPKNPTTFVATNIRSPRTPNADGDFDFSQSSSDQKPDSGMLVFLNKSLNSTRSSKDKGKPIHLRDFQDSDIDESDDSNAQKSANTYNEAKKAAMHNKMSDPSLEFYQ